ncbi:MAG: glycosyltransferase, partial [Candidatus Omnitrophota bacterium]
VAHLNILSAFISPAIIKELKSHNIPVVMSLRDFSIICCQSFCLYKNKPCEACKNHRYYRGLLRKCTHNSFLQSLGNVLQKYWYNKFRNIYDLVDIFIAPSNFIKTKLIEMGFKHNIAYLPNFIFIESEPSYSWERKNIVYMGKLEVHKGIFDLLEAVKQLDVSLTIIGAGNSRLDIEKYLKRERLSHKVIIKGFLSGEELYHEIRNAMFTVCPSIWYENNPRVIIDSFLLGKPVVASNIGGIPELVKDYKTGLLFEPANVEDLQKKISILINNENLIIAMGKSARKVVEKELNPEKHYKQLIAIYKSMEMIG